MTTTTVAARERANDEAARWVAAARALAPTIVGCRDEGARERRPPEPLFAAMRDAGLLDLLTPRSLGGAQVGLTTFLDVVEAVARVDGSAGWLLCIWGAQGLFADYLPADVARAVVAPGNVTCGAVAPTGRAVPVPGGYQVSGRWSFASGCQYATWLIGGCVVFDGDAPRMTAEGAPDVRLAVMPAADCRVVDTWDALGLRATGSHDFAVDGVVVPEERTIPLPALSAGPAARPDAVWATPFMSLVSPMVAAVGFGIAREAIDAFVALAREKVPAGGSTRLVDQHTVQLSVGRAEALLRSARAYLYDTVRDVTAAHAAGAPVTDDDRAAVRLAATHATACAVEAVDLVFEAAGGTAIYAASALERCFRDVHMLTHHMAVAPGNFEMVGQYYLGGTLQMRR